MWVDRLMYFPFEISKFQTKNCSCRLNCVFFQKKYNPNTFKEL